MGDRAKSKNSAQKKKITILALENTVASTVTGPMDIFSLAGVLWNQVRGSRPTPYFEVEIASLGGKKVRCHHGLVIEPHVAMEASQGSDVVLISSADLSTLDGLSKKIVPWLRRKFEQGSSLASVCTGAFLLAATGLLDGKSATTHWGYVEAFRKSYPQVLLKPERLVTDEGNLFCGGGLHSYYDLSLYLIEKFHGFEIASQCSKALLLDLSRPMQSFYAIFDFQKKHGDAEILQAQQWMESHFTQKIQNEDIATRVHMSLRNFKRRFKQATGDSPTSYLQRLRVEKAKRMLENPRHGVESVSGQVGYEDSAFFRELFKKHAGMTPAAYRQRFLK